MNVNVSQQFLNKWMKISHVFQRLSFHLISEIFLEKMDHTIHGIRKDL